MAQVSHLGELATAPGSIVASGTLPIKWVASAAAAATITHGLGKAPKWFSLALVLIGQVAYLQATEVTPTIIQVNGQAPGVYTGEGTIYWAAF